MIVVMVRIPVGSAEEGERIAGRFRHSLAQMDNKSGFIGFELLKGEHEYISVTRFTDRAALDAWTSSQAHGQAHPQAPQTGGHPQGSTAGADAARHPGSEASSTLVYEVVIPDSGN